MKRFEVIETFHDFQLVDNVTGHSACMGDGCGIDVGSEDDPLEVGEFGFRQAWEDTINDDITIYMEIYFPDLYNLVIYDSPKHADRYIVVLGPAGNPVHPEYHECLSLDNRPEHPQGVSMMGWCVPSYVDGSEGQKRISFLDLPQNVQRHIAKRLED